MDSSELWKEKERKMILKLYKEDTVLMDNVVCRNALRLPGTMFVVNVKTSFLLNLFHETLSKLNDLWQEPKSPLAWEIWGLQLQFIWKTSYWWNLNYEDPLHPWFLQNIVWFICSAFKVTLISLCSFPVPVPVPLELDSQ